MSVREAATGPGRSPAFVVSWLALAVVVVVAAAGLLVAALMSTGEVGPAVDPGEQAPTAQSVPVVPRPDGGRG
ncbi:hypothetical protein [Actinotalea caeni]|uniref:hypothetical protein n=1 Tax=Actinotalea caeni TaxID=1348467 RepID=UPI001958C655|nr:hypothetical protein [Actinotalea caeni]